MGAAFVLRIDHTSNYIECHKAVCWQIGAVNTVGSTTTSIKQANVDQVYCVYLQGINAAVHRFVANGCLQ